MLYTSYNYREMEGLWGFCQSSEPYLKRCLEIAENRQNNKWARALNKEAFVVDLCNESDDNSQQNDEKDLKNISTKCKAEDSVENNTNAPEKVLEICDAIESDLTNQFVYVTQKLTDNPSLISSVATKITENAAEKLCNMIYEAQDLDNNFILGYFKNFLPEFLKRDHTRFSVDSVVRGYKKHPVEFKKVVLPLMVKDVNIPNTILLGFINQLDSKDKIDILNSITDVQIDKNQFVNHINALTILFKSCEVIPSIQNFILNCLISSAELCLSNKVFGQLLLAYLSSTDCNFKPLESVVENHNSAFKRPCLHQLRKLENKSDV